MINMFVGSEYFSNIIFFDLQDSGDDGGALALEVANVEGVFLLLIVGSVAAIICSCFEMILDVLNRAMDNKVASVCNMYEC